MTKAGYWTKTGIISLKSLILSQMALLQLWCGICVSCTETFWICKVHQIFVTSSKRNRLPNRCLFKGRVWGVGGFHCCSLLWVSLSGGNAGMRWLQKCSIQWSCWSRADLLWFQCLSNYDLRRFSHPASDRKCLVATAFLYRIWLIKKPQNKWNNCHEYFYR